MSRIFLTPENSMVHQRWKWYYEQPLKSLLANRTFEIPYNEVLGGNSLSLFERICALQHYPFLYKHMLFSISLKFLRPDGDGYFSMEEICSSRPMLFYFHQLNYFPAFYFFLENDVFRSFTRLGLNLIVSDEIKPSINEKGAFNTQVSFKSKQMELILRRVIDSCRQIQLYFHGSGESPDEYITRALETDNLPLTLQDIKAYLKEDLKSNINNLRS